MLRESSILVSLSFNLFRRDCLTLSRSWWVMKYWRRSGFAGPILG